MGKRIERNIRISAKKCEINGFIGIGLQEVKNYRTVLEMDLVAELGSDPGLCETTE